MGKSASMPFATITGDLSEDEKSFIRPWWKRWKTKSIFQVLLLYRADRLQALTNFCLQIHMFNQDVLKTIQNNNLEVDLETINSEAEPNSYLPPTKQSVHKLVFDWHCLSLHGDTTNCEPLADKSLEMLGSEIIARMEMIKNKENEPSKESFEDKEIQTSFDESNQLTLKQSDTIQEELHNNNFHIPTETSSRKQDDEANNNQNTPSVEDKENSKQVLPEVKKFPKIIESEKQSEAERIETPFRPRNIQSHQLSTKPQQIYKSPVKELEEKFRQTKHDDDNDEEPPFNFRAMLRKTNFRINSNNEENLIFHSEKNGFEFDTRRWEVDKHQSELIVTELAPGIRVCGQIADL